MEAARVKSLLLVALLGSYAVQSHALTSVWQSDLTLWRHAAKMAQYKSRPALNYGSALLMTGDSQGAAIWWAHAAELASQPHVPPYDALRTLHSARANLQRLGAAL